MQTQNRKAVSVASQNETYFTSLMLVDGFCSPKNLSHSSTKDFVEFIVKVYISQIREHVKIFDYVYQKIA